MGIGFGFYFNIGSGCCEPERKIIFALSGPMINKTSHLMDNDFKLRPDAKAKLSG